MSSGVGRRCGLDPALLWLWYRLAGAALIRPLAWKPPYAAGVPLKRQKKKKKERKDNSYALEIQREKFILSLEIGESFLALNSIVLKIISHLMDSYQMLTVFWLLF